MSVLQYHVSLQSGPKMAGVCEGLAGHEVMLVKVQQQCDALVK